MNDLLFMSPEYVAAMNAILAADDSVRAACADLGKSVVLAYELSNGPHGDTIYWSLAFVDTVRFSLEPTNADVVFRGDWSRMVNASKANREGKFEDPGLQPTGDLSVLEVIGPVFALASQVATLPVKFPDV